MVEIKGNISTFEQNVPKPKLPTPGVVSERFDYKKKVSVDKLNKKLILYRTENSLTFQRISKNISALQYVPIYTQIKKNSLPVASSLY